MFSLKEKVLLLNDPTTMIEGEEKSTLGILPRLPMIIY